MARGVKRSDLELEAQQLIERLTQIISDLAQNRRRLEALRDQLNGVMGTEGE